MTGGMITETNSPLLADARRSSQALVTSDSARRPARTRWSRPAALAQHTSNLHGGLARPPIDFFPAVAERDQAQLGDLVDPAEVLPAAKLGMCLHAIEF